MYLRKRFTLHRTWIVYVSLCNVLVAQVKCEVNDTNYQRTSKDMIIYRNLFKVKRKEHIAAVQKLLLVDDIAKQAKLIEVMLQTMVDTMRKAIINLDAVGYNANDGFPKDTAIKDDLSKVLENTALFTDLIVRFPKPSQIFYQKNKKNWKMVLKGSIDICSNSGVYEKDYELLLHNLKQEVGIGPKDENYKNPFLESEDTSNELTAEERKIIHQEAKRKKKVKDKKNKRNGPKLSRTEL